MRITRSDRGLAMKDDNTKVDYWSLVNGSLRLFICGPGQNAWFPVTAPCSRSIHHGTPRERDIARRALHTLSLRFHDSTEATARDIREVLEHYGWTPDFLTRYPDT